MKKVYIEITNNCNLDCSFCIKNTRKSMFMSEENFKIILNKLKNTTSYLYFHVMGEPLLPIFDTCSKKSCTRPHKS